MAGGIGGYFSARDPAVALGFAASPHKKEAEDRANEASQDLYAKTGKINEGLDTSTQGYLQGLQGYTSEAQGDLKSLRDQSDAAASDAKQTYLNTVQPRLKDLMEKTGSSAAGAMSLQDAMDPNNKVASGVRDLYERQAQNEGKSGMGAVSTLQNLGAQNFASQLGTMGPMSGGQIAALMGQNQANAGAAFQGIQSRQQDLRDTGLKQGFARTDKAFEQGREAQGDYASSINNYNQGNRQSDQDQTRARAEHSGYGQDIYNLGTGFLGTKQGAAQSKAARDQAAASGYYGGIRETALGQAKDYAADQERKQGMFSGGMGALANMGGGYMSGKYDKKLDQISGSGSSKDASSSSEGGQATSENPDSYDVPAGSTGNETTNDNTGGVKGYAGPSPGGGGNVEEAGLADRPSSISNRMATRSTAAPGKQGVGGGSVSRNNDFAGVGGRLGSMMAPPAKDYSKQQAAWQSAQPQRDSQSAMDQMNASQNSIMSMMRNHKARYA